MSSDGGCDSVIVPPQVLVNMGEIGRPANPFLWAYPSITLKGASRSIQSGVAFLEKGDGHSLRTAS